MECIKALDELISTRVINSKNYKFVVLTPNTEITDIKLTHIITKKVGLLSGHIWEQLELPLYTMGSLLINFCGPAPVIKKKQIVTIHDVGVFRNGKNYSRLFRGWYKFMYSTFKYMSEKIITVSKFSKQEIINIFNINEQKIEYYHLGADHFYDLEADHSILTKNSLKKDKYILAVSSRSANKNFNSVIKALNLVNLMDIDCVIVGGHFSKVFNYQNDKDLLSKVNVKSMGYVTDSELKALYENAVCFIYPSLYEGFGLPPLEAMISGCPVIVSNVTSLPEVCGTAAIYCDPEEIDDIAEKINKVIRNDDLRKEMHQNGLSHSANYRWEYCAKGLFNEIQRCVVGLK